MGDAPATFVEEIDVDNLPDDAPGFEPCEEGDHDEHVDDLVGALAFGTTSRHVLATWLPAAFDKWGVDYSVASGWKDRGRPISAGYFDPNAALIHHTGTASSASNPFPSLKTLIEGRSDLRGPLCQYTTGYNGKTIIIAAGRANHAGKARAVMGNPAGDGNAMLLGNEVQTSGTQKMPQVQYDAVVLTSAAVLDHFGYKDASKLGLHATTSLSGKWDLGAGTGQSGVPYDIKRLRADVTARLKAGPPAKPASTTSPATPAPATSQEIATMLVQIRGTDPVYKSNGFERQHIGPKQLAALKKAGLKITLLDNQTELDAYGLEVPNPAGVK